MRLLNVYTFSFAEFDNRNLPQHAIASHRWTDDEATYEDVNHRQCIHKKGYQKIQNFCRFTQWRNDQIQALGSECVATSRLEYIWVDTCCIDRRNNTELQEDIISMFKYYKRAEECYAYLSDVPSQSFHGEFRQSSWFTRGWTLQELLAPSKVFFLSDEWKILGHKCSGGSGCCSLSSVVINSHIGAVTGIPSDVLSKQRDLADVPPDQVCAWIMNRQTNKGEDLAYCLLGMLGVNMSVRYGEGTGAWKRLRRKVQKQRGSSYSLCTPNQLRHSTPAHAEDPDGEGSSSIGDSNGEESGNESRWPPPSASSFPPITSLWPSSSTVAVSAWPENSFSRQYTTYFTDQTRLGIAQNSSDSWPARHDSDRTVSPSELHMLRQRQELRRQGLQRR